MEGQLFGFRHEDIMSTWYKFMVSVSVLNVVTYLYSIRKPIPNDDSKTYQKTLRILAGIYVLVCGFRAVLPRIDGARQCYYDTWLCYPAIGRTGATIAELSFMAQITLVLHRISTGVREYAVKGKDLSAIRKCNLICTFCKAAFAVNIVAQCFCWTAVATTCMIWHAFEESIWAATLFLFTISCFVLYGYVQKIPIRTSTEANKILLRHTKIFLWLFMIFGPLYVAFMCWVDVPMYWNRWKADEANGKVYLGLLEGFKDSASCRIITQSFEDWGEELPWFSGYFSLAVWLSIYLIQAPRLPQPLPSKID